jgi:hypothetical protein
VTLGVVTLGAVTLGVVTLGAVTLGVVTLGAVTLGVVTLEAVTLGVVTLEAVTLGVVTLEAASAGRCAATSEWGVAPTGCSAPPVAGRCTATEAERVAAVPPAAAAWALARCAEPTACGSARVSRPLAGAVDAERVLGRRLIAGAAGPR